MSRIALKKGNSGAPVADNVVQLRPANGKGRATKAGGVETIRKTLAQELHELSRELAKNTIALGIKLKEARDTFPLAVGAKGPGKYRERPGWKEWIEKEVGFGLRHVNRLIQIAEKFSEAPWTSKTSFHVLRLLMESTTPPLAKREIVKKVKAGKRVTTKEAQAIIKKFKETNRIAKLPTPAQARKQARETGEEVQANNGNYYDGLTKKEREERSQRYWEKADVIIETRDGIERLAKNQNLPVPMFLRIATETGISLDEMWLSVRVAHTWLSKLLPEAHKRGL